MALASSNIQRIKRQVLDYQVDQMKQDQAAQSPTVVPPITSVNYATNAYCSDCGEANAKDAKFLQRVRKSRWR